MKEKQGKEEVCSPATRCSERYLDPLLTQQCVDLSHSTKWLLNSYNLCRMILNKPGIWQGNIVHLGLTWTRFAISVVRSDETTKCSVGSTQKRSIQVVTHTTQGTKATLRVTNWCFLAGALIYLLRSSVWWQEQVQPGCQKNTKKRRSEKREVHRQC